MDVRKIRKNIGLQQGQFWPRIGVTQSGGSRYEAGRAMPAPVAMLVDIAYGNERQSGAIIKRLRAVKRMPGRK